MYFKSILLAGALALAAAPAMSETYLCKFGPRAGGGWLGGDMLFEREKGDQFRVMTGTSKRYTGGAVMGRASTENNKRITIKWALDQVRNQDLQTAPALDYKITIVKSTLKAHAVMYPRGYSNDFKGRGVCTLR